MLDFLSSVTSSVSVNLLVELELGIRVVSFLVSNDTLIVATISPCWIILYSNVSFTFLLR